MGDIAPNFSRHEFACKCGCGYDTVDCELVGVLQDLSDHFDNRTVSISSGCRCSTHNMCVGGSKDSQHLKGKAADVSIHGVDPAVVYAYLTGEHADRYGFGKYPTFTHIDVRRKRARW